MSAYRVAKRAALRCIQACGGFKICDRLVGHGLQILCYHGISLLDEERFRPGLFMKSEVFAARMDWLASNGFRPLTLEDAVARLQQRTLPARAIVLTFDDGWFGCLDGAFDKLNSLGWPATLYVTTYYSENREPVFNVAVHYLLWKSAVTLDLRTLHDGLQGSVTGDGAARARAADSIVAFGQSQLTRGQRRDLLYALASRLGFDPVDLFERRRVMTLMDLGEIRRSAAKGISIQLHTHRHRFPLDDDDALRQEISDNREVLESSGFRDLVHLCYPSGVYDRRTFPVLRAINVKTATTTNPGLNFPDADPLSLTRLLDTTSMEEVEFAGEMFGVGEVLRSLRGSLKGS